MQIREYQKQDEIGWVRCRVLSFLDTSYYDDVLQEKERYENDAIELVAIADGMVVGLLDVECEQESGQICSDRTQRSGMIWHLAVHPDYRRRRIAAALLEQVNKELKKKNINRIEAWTRDDELVNNWYKAMGFRSDGFYYHVFADGPEEAAADIEIYLPQLKPITMFAHYTGKELDLLRKHYTRIHKCTQYVKTM